MNGYSLTEKMHRTRKSVRLTALEQALYYELVAVCNGKKWKAIFTCSNTRLCLALNISERTLVKARDSLINANLIYYRSGKSTGKVSTYSFTIPLVHTTTPETISEGTPAITKEDTPANISDYININSFKTPSIPKEESESVKDRLLADETWKEQIALQSGMGIAFVAMLPQQVECFFQYIVATGEEHTVQTLSDAKRRFFWWWKKLGKKTYENNSNNLPTLIW